MAVYVVRVWLPDRPGALGAVASRIGAVRGDLVGVDILERGGGRAIDELVVELPRASLVDLLVHEVNQVDGVDVEDVRAVPGAVPVDPRLDALETAAYLVERDDAGELLRALASHAARDLEADWAAVVDPSAAHPLASVGSAPAEAWVFAFVRGAKMSMSMAASGGGGGRRGSRGDAALDGSPASRHGLTGGVGGLASPSDVAWADMASSSLVLVLGRDGRPFRARERRQLSALARIADTRWMELAKIADGSAPAVPAGAI